MWVVFERSYIMTLMSLFLTFCLDFVIDKGYLNKKYAFHTLPNLGKAKQI